MSDHSKQSLFIDVPKSFTKILFLGGAVRMTNSANGRVPAENKQGQRTVRVRADFTAPAFGDFDAEQETRFVNVRYPKDAKCPIDGLAEGSVITFDGFFRAEFTPDDSTEVKHYFGAESMRKVGGQAPAQQG
jgi:hypothetical protein